MGQTASRDAYEVQKPESFSNNQQFTDNLRVEVFAPIGPPPSGFSALPERQAVKDQIGDDKLQSRPNQPINVYDQVLAIAARETNRQPANENELFEQAIKMMRSEGMTPSTKAHFENAIRSADSLFNPQDEQLTYQLIRELQTGRKTDGSVLSVQERAQKHIDVQQEIARAVSGLQYRMVYGSLLNESKQYASAERIFKENISIADRLPLQAFQAELTQLNKDAQNPQFDRNRQSQFFKMMQNIQGSGVSRDDGLLYLPVTARKQAALFYVAGAQEPNTGLVKSIEASQMIDQAKAKEQELYGVTADKLKLFDPTLANMAQAIVPLLPENLRKEKQEADTFWSNAIVDGGTAAGVMTLAAVTAAVLTKNPKVAGLLVEGGKLSAVGYGVIGAGALGSEVLARHAAHKFVTGDDESWTTSTIHGTAALGSVAAMIGTRAKVGEFLYKGATAEAIAPQLVRGYGLSEGATVSEFVTALGKSTRIPESISALAKGESASKPFIDAATGSINAEVAQALNGYYSNAQLANMAGGLMADATSIGKWYTPSGAYARAKGAFSPLDFGLENNQLAGSVAFRSLAGSYSTAFAGIGTYKSITSLDVGIDPKTGKPMSYTDSFFRSHYRSITDNTATEALWLGAMPAMADGVLAQGAYAEAAGALGAVKAPFRVSVLESMGAKGVASADLIKTGLQASDLAIVSTIYNISNVSKVISGASKSSSIGQKLEATSRPISDEADAPSFHSH
ncbi:MAG TPA: hypothetical protein V6C89_08715 [Drouetiella sp.]|jgi:hypothetical protein